MPDPAPRLAVFRARSAIHSETFDYHLHDWEGITYTWDVVAGQQLANGREILMEAVEPLVKALQEGAAEISYRRVLTDASINPDLPCLVVPLPFPPQPDGSTQHVLIDGWHRVARAWGEGRSEIPIVILTEAEELLIRLRPAPADLLARVAEIRASRAKGGVTR